MQVPTATSYVTPSNLLANFDVAHRWPSASSSPHAANVVIVPRRRPDHDSSNASLWAGVVQPALKRRRRRHRAGDLARVSAYRGRVRNAERAAPISASGCPYATRPPPRRHAVSPRSTPRWLDRPPVPATTLAPAGAPTSARRAAEDDTSAAGTAPEATVTPAHRGADRPARQKTAHATDADALENLLADDRARHASCTPCRIKLRDAPAVATRRTSAPPARRAYPL